MITRVWKVTDSWALSSAGYLAVAADWNLARGICRRLNEHPATYGSRYQLVATILIDGKVI